MGLYGHPLASSICKLIGLIGEQNQKQSKNQKKNNNKKNVDVADCSVAKPQNASNNTNDLVVVKNNFEHEIKALNQLVEDNKTSITFSSKKEKFGIFFDHKVTGEEFNSFIIELQRVFFDVLENNDKKYKEFVSTVYNTFDYLDKEYLDGILVAIKSAEKASNDAKQASDEALKAQQDIYTLIEQLKKTVEKFSEFKQEVNSYAHLEDIDAVWELSKKHEEYIKNDDTKERLRTVYFLSAGALAVSVIHIILACVGLL